MNSPPSGWFKDAIIYHIFIDRFSRGKTKDKRPKRCKGPVFCGGNLQGIIDRLDYLQDLGVNTIWLSPFNKTSAYHGYHITDYYNIDSRFGTLETVKELVEIAHKKGIRILMDFVPNHVSYRHPYFLDAQKNKMSKYRKWFYFVNWPKNYLCFLDVKELPKLNLDYGPARQHVINVAKFWLSQGIDGLRIDCAPGPSNEFWIEFRKVVKKHKPSAVLIGEVWFKGVKWHHLKTINLKHKRFIFLSSISHIARTKLAMRQYMQEFDGVLDFEFQRLITSFIAKKTWYKPEWLLRWKLREHYKSFPKGYLLLTFLDNHDMNRFLFEVGQNKERLKQAAKIQFEQKPPPIIYYGTEVGLTQKKDIKDYKEHGDLEARQMMSWKRQDKLLLAFYKQLINTRRSA